MTRRRFTVAMISASLALLLVLPALAQQPPEAQSKPVELLLKLDAGVDFDAVRQTLNGHSLQSVSTGDARGFSENLNLLRVTYPDMSAALRALVVLRSHPLVQLAEVEQQREFFWEPETEPDYPLQAEWVRQVDLPGAWNISTGNDTIVVGVVDSGVSPTHPDLVGKLVDGYNASTGDDDWADQNGHGTHVAGIIAANGTNGLGTAGAAMDVNIMPVRVVDVDGVISTASISEGIIWAVDNGADVINLSFGAQTPSTVEQDAVQYAYENNIPVLAAAGNYATLVSYPASYPEAISVGAVDNTGNRARFSSVVSRVDLAAPGVLIYSPHWSVAGDGWTNTINNRPVSGTSFSVAIASGVAGLLLSIDSSLGPEDVRSVLRSTATDSGDPGNESGVGAGQLDAEGAVRQVAFRAMYDTWYPTDSLVAAGAVERTWLWGEDPPAHFAYEPYAEAQHNVRLVYYYDKSRMEITDPFADVEASWYVTNGLLVNELISGQMQVGDAEFVPMESAAVNVAGDADDTLGPTYATFGGVLDAAPVEADLPIFQTISRDGIVGSDSLLASYGVVGGYLDETTNHRIANVFWDYLNSSGLIAIDDEIVDGQLFEPWFFATGLPVTEAYWSKVTVAGVVQDVLMQCFERRCLTYTPANPLAWQVEMGNVGLHYYIWRYGDEGGSPGEPPVEETAPGTGELLFEAGFDQFGTAMIAEGSREIVEEGYLINVITEDFEIGALVPQLVVEDAIVRGTVRFLNDEGTGEFCVVNRFQQATGSRYLACVWPNGDVQLAFKSANGEEQLLYVAGYVHPSAMSAGVEVGILSAGNSHWLEINGLIVGHVIHDGPSTGSAGLVGVGVGMYLTIGYRVSGALPAD